MKKTAISYYQKLPLIPKLSTPMALVLLFGVLLTVFIIKQVNLIQTNTTLLKSEIIPAFEKSTQNITLLKNISEKLIFAHLTAEEDMVLDIEYNHIIEQNLKDILSHENLNLRGVDTSLKAFHNYFEVASQYTLSLINNNSLNHKERARAEALLRQYNEVKRYFLQLNADIKREISLGSASIHETSMQLIYFTVVYIIILAIVLFFTSDYSVIQAQRRELSKINENVQHSLEYALLIQEAILPSNDILDAYTKDNFIFWKQRDTVGGDIYFVVELKSKNEILVMVIDGVGHGVSGAFLTILTKALESQIVEKINRGVVEPSPAEILKYFNNAIKSILRQEKGSESNVGFDGGVLYYNRETNRCRYAGAKTPLYLIHDNQLEVIKSDRKSIGFIRNKMNQEYQEYDIEIKEGTKLYISTDGILDQESENNNRYGKARFEQFIIDNHHKRFHQQLKLLKESFLEIKGSLEQSDDITVVGLEFK